ncbi:MAG: rod shape-determining protein MreD [Armatimonadetes bacterium]|nr:rod shape-determining protein MreD [Armatimonadota bacterium]
MKPAQLAIILLLFLVLQTSVFPVILPAGYRPELITVMVVCVALLKGSQTGTAFGFLAGVLEDFASGRSAGVLAFVKTSVGFLAGVVPSRVSPDSVFIPALAVYAFSFLEQVVFYFLAFSGNVPPYPLPWKELLYPFAALNAALALVVNLVIRPLVVRPKEFFHRN